MVTLSVATAMFILNSRAKDNSWMAWTSIFDFLIFLTIAFNV